MKKITEVLARCPITREEDPDSDDDKTDAEEMDTDEL
jgi:hypothetical protein